LGFTYNVVNFENYSTYFGIENQKLLLEAVHILLTLKPNSLCARIQHSLWAQLVCLPL